MPRHELSDFGDDEQTVSNIQTLKSIGVPYLIVHLATCIELKVEVEYSMGYKDHKRMRALVKSLNHLTGQPIYGTLEHVDLPINDLETLSNKYPEDIHPSLQGHRFYADTVAEILRQHDYLFTNKFTMELLNQK